MHRFNGDVVARDVLDEKIDPNRILHKAATANAFDCIFRSTICI
jgi:hypothetical protein